MLRGIGSVCALKYLFLKREDQATLKSSLQIQIKEYQCVRSLSDECLEAWSPLLASFAPGH